MLLFYREIGLKPADVLYFKDLFRPKRSFPIKTKVNWVNWVPGIPIYLSIYLIQSDKSWAHKDHVCQVPWGLAGPELVVRASFGIGEEKSKENVQPHSVKEGWIFSTSILGEKWPVDPGCFSFILVTCTTHIYIYVDKQIIIMYIYI